MKRQEYCDWIKLGQENRFLDTIHFEKDGWHKTSPFYTQKIYFATQKYLAFDHFRFTLTFLTQSLKALRITCY